MKITGELADKLLEIVNTKCKGDVHLISQYGDNYNLKSRLTQYLAIAAMAKEYGDALELFCDVRTTRSILWSSSKRILRFLAGL